MREQLPVYLAVVIGAVLIFLLFRWLRRLAAGARLGRNVLLLEEARPGTPGALFVTWLRENPARLAQHKMFVDLMSTLGYPQARCAENVTRCIVESWKSEDATFGRRLAAEVDHAIESDDAKNDATKEAARAKAVEMLDEYKRKLIALDSPT